jgi:A/G-specific adenine glycosylase
LKKLIIKGMGGRYFSDKIVKWYADNRRPLPWRDTTDPYRIWLSEVILQQTRVAQGLPYYHAFLESFASVNDLAMASEQQVLRLWQGLGYYTRARNLHKCAQTVVKIHKGRFPTTFKELQTLPGVGQYTAAAIASFAFGEAAAVVDGNVFRVLSRIFGITVPINSPLGRKKFSDLAAELLSQKQPGLHNQAIMEFGATLCTPRNPRCEDCPFQLSCVAYTRGLIDKLPVKTDRKKSRKRYFFYVVVDKDRSLLMKKREEKDIWHGLFDFLLIEKDKPAKPEHILAEKGYKKWFQKVDSVTVSKKYVHILSHQTIHCRFIHVKAKATFRPSGTGLSFYSPVEIAELPKPSLISRFLDDQNRY